MAGVATQKGEVDSRQDLSLDKSLMKEKVSDTGEGSEKLQDKEKEKEKEAGVDTQCRSAIDEMILSLQKLKELSNKQGETKNKENGNGNELFNKEKEFCAKQTKTAFEFSV